MSEAGLKASLEGLRAMKLKNEKNIFKDEASLLETRLQGRGAMEIWNKTPWGRLRDKPGTIEIGAKQNINILYIYIYNYIYILYHKEEVRFWS